MNITLMSYFHRSRISVLKKPILKIAYVVDKQQLYIASRNFVAQIETRSVEM